MTQNRQANQHLHQEQTLNPHGLMSETRPISTLEQENTPENDQGRVRQRDTGG